MACKVSSRGILGRLFRTEPQPVMSASCRNLVQSLEMSAEPAASSDNVRSCLQAVSTLLDSAATTSLQKNDILSGLLAADVPVKLLEALPKLEFEAAKDSMRLFSQILKFGTTPVFDYIRCHKQILHMLLAGCGNAEVSLQSNIMVRSCTKHAELVEMLFEAGFATGLIDLVQHQNFDVGSDAFCSLRELLQGCKPVSAEYMMDNGLLFFAEYHVLLNSEDYFTKRQALCLLSEVLLDENFSQVASRYASNHKYLQIHMNLLRDTSKSIHSEAFRVFDLFVQNLQASARVHQILFKNKDRLVKLLESMCDDAREADKSFVEDRLLTAHTLQDLAARNRTYSDSVSNSSSDTPTNQQISRGQAVPNDYALNFIQWHSIF